MLVIFKKETLYIILNYLSPPFLMMSYLRAFFGQETSYIILILHYASWFKESPYHNITNYLS